jgi:uncharacterized protein YndB with AHSA1/START domain
LAADSVERDILIEASAEVVWRVITEPEQIRRWLSDEADLEARAGADGTLTWTPGGRAASDKGAGSVVPIRVVEMEPLRRFAFRWNHPHGQEPDATNSALVEFTLSEEAAGTRLNVLESGIEAVTSGEEDRTRYLEGHTRGWEKHLGELLHHVASQARERTR